MKICFAVFELSYGSSQHRKSCLFSYKAIYINRLATTIFKTNFNSCNQISMELVKRTSNVSDLYLQPSVYNCLLLCEDVNR